MEYGVKRHSAPTKCSSSENTVLNTDSLAVEKWNWEGEKEMNY